MKKSSLPIHLIFVMSILILVRSSARNPILIEEIVKCIITKEYELIEENNSKLLNYDNNAMCLLRTIAEIKEVESVFYKTASNTMRWKLNSTHFAST